MTFADVVRMVGLVLCAAAIPLLIFGQSAGDCIVIALVGIGFLQVPGP